MYSITHHFIWTVLGNIDRIFNSNIIKLLEEKVKYPKVNVKYTKNIIYTLRFGFWISLKCYQLI